MKTEEIKIGTNLEIEIDDGLYCGTVERIEEHDGARLIHFVQDWPSLMAYPGEVWDTWFTGDCDHEKDDRIL